MSNNAFIYTTYIKSTPEKIWQAITTPEFTRQYWGNKVNVSDWKKGSKWEHLDTDTNHVMLSGEVVESTPPKRLVVSWIDPDNKADKSRLTYDIETVPGMVKLTITHDNFIPGSTMAGKVAMGWPLVLSSLKSFLETGKPIDIIAIKKCAAA